MPVVATKHQHTEHPRPSHGEPWEDRPSPSQGHCWERLLFKAARRLESHLDELEQVREFVRSACASLPATMVDEEIIDRLELAMTEAVTNVIHHAYHERPGQSILMETEVNDEQIGFRLYHRGEAFDPPPPALPLFDGHPEHGFGLYIIRQCVTSVT